MIRKVLLLLLLTIFAFGCVAQFSQSPLLKKEPVYKTSSIQMAMYIVHVHDLDNDGEPDTIVVYIKNGDGEKDLVQVLNRPLNEKELAHVKKALEEQARRDKKVPVTN